MMIHGEIGKISRTPEAWSISQSNNTKLRAEQIESVIRVAEHAARVFITSKLQKGEVEDVEITVEADTDGELYFDVEVNLDTALDSEVCQQIVDGAVEAAHAAIRTQLDRIAKQ
jgi:hypothetical protein